MTSGTAIQEKPRQALQQGERKNLKLSEIVVDEDIQIRSDLDPETVGIYALQEVYKTALVTVFAVERGEEDVYYLLAGGFHRHAAAKQNEEEEIEAYVIEGTWEDAKDFAATDNAGNARQLTASERRAAILWLHEHHSRGRGTDWTGGWSYARLSQTFGLSVSRCKNIVSEARAKEEEYRNGTQQTPASTGVSAPATTVEQSATSPNATSDSSDAISTATPAGPATGPGVLADSTSDSAPAATADVPSAVSDDAGSEQQAASPTTAPAPADANEIGQPPDAEVQLSLGESLHALSELTRAADVKALDATELHIANLTEQQQQRLIRQCRAHSCRVQEIIEWLDRTQDLLREQAVKPKKGAA